MTMSPEESLGYWVSVLSRMMQVFVARQLAAYRVGAGHYHLLARLFSEDGVSQKDLAASLHMDKGAVAHALQRLEANGFVLRERDPEDQRVSRVYLTVKAKGIQAPLFTALASQNSVLADGFSKEDRTQALALLKRMARNAARALQEQERPQPGN